MAVVVAVLVLVVAAAAAVMLLFFFFFFFLLPVWLGWGAEPGTDAFAARPCVCAALFA